MTPPGFEAADLLRRAFGRAAAGVAIAPGRVNVIGEHLDYNGGHVLPVAIDRATQVAWAPRDDFTLRVRSAAFDETVTVDLRRLAAEGLPPWARYVAGVAWALREGGHTVRGADLAVWSDVPPGSGLSSSAALEVAVAGALRAAAGLDLPDRDLALLARRAENAFVGVACGVMDQLATALCRRGQALLIDTAHLTMEHVPLPLESAGVALVVVHTGLPRTLAASAYNQRRAECEEASRRLRAALGRPIDALADVGPGELDAAAAALPETLYRRARHVVTEEARVREAVRLLREGREEGASAAFEALGRLLDASHQSLRDDFEVSCLELDLLCELSRSFEGTLGARLTGAGFGGATVHLVRREALGRFEAAVVQPYRERTGLDAWWFETTAADGLRVWEVAS
ncbi:MAG TPA: galactokinase [Dehalococcoidia bacterium]|nr:galactokinase [Dehalococcoidia bacterium]